MLLPMAVHAEDIDTEHVFGFMIGTDVGNVGEREFQSQTTGRFAKAGGSYRVLNHEFELEFVPVNNFRIEAGAAFALHDIGGVTGLDDRSQFTRQATQQATWQGFSLDLRYKFLDRRSAPVGLTFAMEGHIDRIDEITGLPARRYGADMTLAFERDLIPDISVAALNLIYQPEWTRFFGSGAAEQDSTIGASIGVMTKVTPSILLGGEVRYLRKYEGVGLDEFAGQAFFIGPTAYFQLSERARLTATWSFQAWGRPAGSAATLDLVSFERHQARLVFGLNF